MATNKICSVLGQATIVHLIYLKNTLLALEPWICVWHIVHAWYFADWS